jgi:hypothetical protein
MTLVVTEARKDHIIMVGDSALTRRRDGVSIACGGCQKVHHAIRANVGFSMWGSAYVGDIRMDHWLARWIRNNDCE